MHPHYLGRHTAKKCYDSACINNFQLIADLVDGLS